VVIEDEYGAVQAAAAPRATAVDGVSGPSLDAVLRELKGRTRELPWPGREALRVGGRAVLAGKTHYIFCYN